MQAKADLHVHSMHSNRPSEWILRRIGAPECFVPPLDVHRRALQRGMKFVTITDHNSIAGALEIAHLPNTFLSAEVTTYFPEDRCKVHILTYGLTEAVFAEIQEVRESIYELRDLLLDRGVVHSVSHPLFSVNDKLTVEHVEKLLVMFQRFEVLNGTRHDRANRLAEAILTSLRPDDIEMLANHYDIDPRSPRPWRKFLTGGSDDHSGVYVASAYTVTPDAVDVDTFLHHLREGDHRPGGRSGTSLRLAHSFYHIAYSYYQHRLLNKDKPGSRLLDGFLSRLLSDDTAERTRGGRLRGLADRMLKPLQEQGLSEVERRLVSEFGDLVDTPDTPMHGDNDERTFQLACRICHRVSYHFLERFLEHLREMSLIETLQTFASLAPVGLSVAPYLAAFVAQHKDEPLLRMLAQKFEVPSTAGGIPTRKAWFTDTYRAPDGMHKTISSLAPLARRQGHDLTIVTCLEEPCGDWELSIVNFPPEGSFELPEYTDRKLCFPPFLSIIEYLERERFSEVIISTPGPLGLVALAAGRTLGLEVTGIYDTDYPGCVEKITDDEYLRQVTWRYMCWFYGEMDRVYVSSESYRKQFRENGLTHKPVDLLGPGVDTERFNPLKRDPEFWRRHGCNAQFTFLSVGDHTTSDEHHASLLDAFIGLRDGGCEADLVILGQETDLGDLPQRANGRTDIAFPGPLRGESLARAYASADVFVLPGSVDGSASTVLEAHASGLPAIVTSDGTPADIVRRYESGIVVPHSDTTALAEAMRSLADDRQRCAAISRNALAGAASNTWTQVLHVLWHGSRAATADEPPAERAEPARHGQPVLAAEINVPCVSAE